MKVNYLESRHIGLTPEDEKQMMKAVGAESLDALVRETMPADILLPEPIELDEPYTEQQQLEVADTLLSQNEPARSYIGRGWYGTITPAVIRRNVLENPVWYTSYTPFFDSRRDPPRRGAKFSTRETTPASRSTRAI